MICSFSLLEYKAYNKYSYKKIYLYSTNMVECTSSFGLLSSINLDTLKNDI